jgi:general secretion pathway protein D
LKKQCSSKEQLQSLAQRSPQRPIFNLALASCFLISQVIGSLSLAQEDFTPPPPAIDNFGDLPPPPPIGGPAPNAGGFNSFEPPSAPSRPSGNETVIKPSNGKTSILDSKQREKFAKANAEEITSENFPETIESFDFPNVEITDIIKAISELTGKNFIIDSTVRGKITIIAPSKITVAEAYKAFLSSLAINGFTVVPSGGFLKIRNARSAQRDGIDIYSGNYYPNSDQMITKVVHLKHITADTVKTQLGRLLNSSYGEIEAYPQTNSIIISDFGSSIDRIMKIINQLDVPGFEEQLEVVGIKYARAKDIADLIDKVVNKGQRTTGSNTGGGFNAGVPRFSSGGNSANRGGSSGGGISSFMVFPEDRTNSLIIVGNRAGIARVKRLILQLDFKVSAENSGGVYVYYVKHGDAEKIAATLSEVAKDATPKPAASTPTGGFGFAPQGQAAVREAIFGGDVTIKADKNTNAIVISASKQDYEKVLSILGKLDIPRDQVFVEAIIMEMTVNDGNDSGGGLVQFSKDGGKAGFASSQTDVQDFLSPLAGGGKAILGFGSGPITVKDPITDKSFTVPSLIGYLNFIKTFGKTNILSRPTITAMDAQTATIEVGNKVVTRSIVTPGANGTQAQVQPEFDDATIKLEIKPFISPASETIRMEFTQNIKQISNVTVPKGFDGLVQPLATRQIKTNVVLNSGDTAVIGGLMKDEEIEVVRKVPLLGDLPILGWFFKKREVKKEKVNMVVFLSPKILRNNFDRKELLDDRVAERLNFIKNTSGKDPYGSTVDKILKRNVRAPQSTTGGKNQ